MVAAQQQQQEHRTRRFSAEEVWRMVETGVIAPDERVQLIEGELIVMSPQGSVHATLVAELPILLSRSYGPGFHVRSQSSIVGTHDTIPEPDTYVVRGQVRDYLSRLPGPADIPLVAEISDSTLALDRRKADVYARAGYATYWLINVQARQLEVRSAPVKGLYTRTDILGEEATVTPPEANGSLRVAELLPDP